MIRIVQSKSSSNIRAVIVLSAWSDGDHKHMKAERFELFLLCIVFLLGWTAYKYLYGLWLKTGLS